MPFAPITLICFILIRLLLFTPTCFAEGLLVYIPSTLPTNKIEKKISEMTKAKVTAFSKYSDLEAGIEALRPDAVITTEALPFSVSGYELATALKINGQNKSKYLLLALDPSWKKKGLAKVKVGTIEFVKRANMKDYFQKIFGGAFKTIKTVSKADDLIPLLVFKQVDAIAVQPHVHAELKEKFNTQLVEIGQSSEIQALTLFKKKNEDLKQDLNEVKTLDFESTTWRGK